MLVGRVRRRLVMALFFAALLWLGTEVEMVCIAGISFNNKALSPPRPPASSGFGPEMLFSAGLLRWRMADGCGSGKACLNKLRRTRFRADLEVYLLHPCCRGDGKDGEEDLDSKLLKSGSRRGMRVRASMRALEAALGCGVHQWRLFLAGVIHGHGVLTLMPVLGAECEFSVALCWELAAMLRQVQEYRADASNSFAELPSLLLRIYMGSSNPCNFFPMSKDWSLSDTAQGFAISSPKFEKCFPLFDLLLLEIWLDKMICKNCTSKGEEGKNCKVAVVWRWSSIFLAVGAVSLMYQMASMLVGEVEHNELVLCCIWIRKGFEDASDEGVGAFPFGMFHRWRVRAPLLLVLRFDGRDKLQPSSVKLLTNLQLDSFQPQVHKPIRTLGEPSGYYRRAHDMRPSRIAVVVAHQSSRLIRHQAPSAIFPRSRLEYPCDYVAKFVMSNFAGRSSSPCTPVL